MAKDEELELNKQEMVMLAYDVLGMEASASEVTEWVEKKYETKVSGGTIQAVRSKIKQAMEAKAAESSLTSLPASKPKPAQPKPKPATPAVSTTTPVPTPSAGGVLDTIKQVRALIDRLGKDELKELIDAL